MMLPMQSDGSAGKNGTNFPKPIPPSSTEFVLTENVSPSQKNVNPNNIIGNACSRGVHDSIFKFTCMSKDSPRTDNVVTSEVT